jgi:hypothetical protein
MPIDARISTGLPHHPKTKKIIRRLGHEGSWSLVCLFLWSAQNRPDGEFDGMTAEDIEIAAGWEGEPNAFVEALIEVRFLEQTDDGYKIHNWEKHNPWAAGAEARSNRAKFAALCRRHGKKEAIKMMPDYADSMQDEGENPANSRKNPANGMRLAEFSSAPSPSPLPSPSPNNKNTANKVEKPEDIDQQIWQDFLDLRRQKKAKLTLTAWERIRKELDRGKEQGYTPNDMMAEAVASGWQAFKLDWYLNRVQKSQPEIKRARTELR